MTRRKPPEKRERYFREVTVTATPSPPTGRALPAEVESLIAEASADRLVRARVRAELRGLYAASGMSRRALAELLENEAGLLKAADAEDLRRERRAGR